MRQAGRSHDDVEDGLLALLDTDPAGPDRTIGMAVQSRTFWTSAIAQTAAALVSPASAGVVLSGSTSNPVSYSIASWGAFAALPL